VRPKSEIAPTRVAMVEEIARAKKICDKSKQAVVSMFQEVRMGRAVSPDLAGSLVDEISNSVQRNPGALISLARLKSADDYTYMHSVAVCALMVALARQLGLEPSPPIRELGLAGLLHDLGKAMVPTEILNKPGKLTDEEFAIMKGIRAMAIDMLVEGAGGRRGSRSTCACIITKRPTAAGIRTGSTGDRSACMPKWGRSATSMTPSPPTVPTRPAGIRRNRCARMAEWCKGHFDERIFQAFVKCGRHLSRSVRWSSWSPGAWAW
jgi:HD-GYP domain-containing protein (c-di-GMP phosphodiesterase class II)